MPEPGLAHDFTPGGRPNFKIVHPKKRECADCGVSGEEMHADDIQRWPDGKALRYYPADDEWSCRRCAEGDQES